jgi:hypothetical protein
VVPKEFRTVIQCPDLHLRNGPRQPGALTLTSTITVGFCLLKKKKEDKTQKKKKLSLILPVKGIIKAASGLL